MAGLSIDSRLSLATGRTMPVLGLGTWQLTDNTVGTVEEALRLGYRMIDTAGDYGTHSIDQIEELSDATGEQPVVNQIEWSPFGWSPQMLDYCNEVRVVIQAYSPLTRTRRLADERLVDTAAAYGKTPAQLLVRWNLQLGIAPLPKANRRQHLAENLGVFDVEIADVDMVELGQFNEHYSSLGRLQYV
jgi:diketogulonate reductase-like aldo/keto reductase